MHILHLIVPFCTFTHTNRVHVHTHAHTNRHNPAVTQTPQFTPTVILAIAVILRMTVMETVTDTTTTPGITDTNATVTAATNRRGLGSTILLSILETLREFIPSLRLQRLVDVIYVLRVLCMWYVSYICVLYIGVSYLIYVFPILRIHPVPAPTAPGRRDMKCIQNMKIRNVYVHILHTFHITK